MIPRRPTRVCAELLLDALQKLGPSARPLLYEYTGLTTNEMHRGLRCLQDAKVIRRGPDDQPDCYALTGRELPARSGTTHAKPTGPEISFDGLLSTWGIRHPAQERSTRRPAKHQAAE